MSKEKNYFSHDYNARNDRKISALVLDYKAAGYGIYWCTAEMMHEEGGAMELDDLTFSAIAKDLNEDFELVKNVIEKCISTYRLFFISDKKLTANRVKRNLDKRKEVSEVRAEAGRNGAIAKQKKAIANQVPAIAEQTEPIVQQIQAKKEIKKEIKKESVEAQAASGDAVVFVKNMKTRFMVSNPNYSESDEDFPALYDILNFIRGQTGVENVMYNLSSEDQEKITTVWDEWIPMIVKKFLNKSLSEISRFKKTEISNIVKNKGTPKSEKHSGTNEKLKGTKFNEDFTEVIFSDGTAQKLSQDQATQAKHGLINPKAIVQGILN